MSKIIIEGVHTHVQDGTVVYYRYQYQRRPVGIVYEVDVGFGDAKSRLMSGVIGWSIRSLLFPRRIIEKTIFESIDMFDIEDFRAKF